MRPINLLPPEAKTRAVARRRAVLWVLVILLYVAGLGAATLWFRGRVDSAQERLDAQQSVVRDLRAEVAELEEFATVRADFEARVVVVSGILARDVAWARILNDFGRLIPPRVWLNSFTGTVSSDAALIGQITVSGTAFDYPDVASWLRSLDSVNFPGVSATWVSGVASSEIGQASVVDFSSTTALTPDALSDRLGQRIPELP